MIKGYVVYPRYNSGEAFFEDSNEYGVDISLASANEDGITYRIEAEDKQVIIYWVIYELMNIWEDTVMGEPEEYEGLRNMDIAFLGNILVEVGKLKD